MQSSAYKIYNASAGSGKTYQLAKSYLGLILAPKTRLNFRQLLALTFTNKAVGEMKTRILQNLYDFSLEAVPKKSKSLFLELQDEFGYSDNELRSKSSYVLKELLHNYGFFEVLTIDKFNHKIIRTFARDLKVAQNFEVELDTESLLNDAVLNVLDKAGSDTALTQTLIDFSLEKIDDNKSWNIAHDLNQIGRMLFQENHSSHLEGLRNRSVSDFNTLKKTIKKTIAALEQDCITKAGEVLLQIEEMGFDHTDFPRETLPNHFKKIANGETQLRALYANKIEENLIQGKVLKSSVDKPGHQLLPFLMEKYQEIKGLVHRIKAYKNVYTNIVPLSLINEIYKAVKNLQEDRNILSISDFNTIIAKEVKDQPVPFIYERLGEKYRHFFIDEFQDTSKKQWSNLIPLVSNALEGMNEKGETGSLLLVGDVKQSIYRWRGGEATQFLELSTKISNPFSVPPHIIRLERNWRSSGNIIAFNNRFFTYISTVFNTEGFAQLYIEGNKQTQNSLSGGYVQVSFLQKEKEATIDPHCQKALETIKNIMALGHSYKDICILVRENKKGMLVADFLAQNNIPLVSADVLLLKNSPEVAFLIGLMKHAESPKEKIHAFEVLSYLCPKDKNLHNFLEQHLENIEGFLLTHYGFSIEELVFLPIFDFLEIAIQRFDLAKDSSAYLNYFMDVVMDHSKKESITMYGFLEYWEGKQKSLAISAPENLDAVNIMTIHKSKGLEFPFVIFPFANGTVSNPAKKDAIWIPLDPSSFHGFEELLFKASQELEYFSDIASSLYQEEAEKTTLDAINVLYVALTRAIKGLFISSDEEKSNSTTQTYGTLLKGYFAHGDTPKTDSEFCIGELPIKDREDNVEKKEKTIPYIYTPHLALGNSPIKLAASLKNEKNKDAIAEGNLIHSLMADIHTKEDITIALQNRVVEGALLQEDIDYYGNLAQNIVTHTKLAPFYAKGIQSFNEFELLNVDGSTARPDRLILFEKKAVLIDYKTGQPQEAHKNQLHHYAGILSKMGYFVSDKVVVYIDQDITPIFV